jgi:hypothetical protein
MDAKITDLHSAYCEATGFDLPLRMGRDRAWFDFEKAGFTKDDLLLVIRWIRKQIPRGAGYSIHSLRFSTLLQLDTFEEKLQLARHELKLRPARPATVTREVQTDDIRRQVEMPNEAEPVEASAEVKQFMADLDRRRAARKDFPLPSS